MREFPRCSAASHTPIPLCLRLCLCRGCSSVSPLFSSLSHSYSLLLTSVSVQGMFVSFPAVQQLLTLLFPSVNVCQFPQCFSSLSDVDFLNVQQPVTSQFPKCSAAPHTPISPMFSSLSHVNFPNVKQPLTLLIPSVNVCQFPQSSAASHTSISPMFSHLSLSLFALLTSVVFPKVQQLFTLLIPSSGVRE